MRNLAKSTCLALALLFVIVKPSFAYVYCTTTVEEIQPNKTSGIVYFKFDDGTAIQASTSSSGLEMNFSVALAALMAGRPVKIALSDGYSCGANNAENWSYIIAI